MTTPAAPLADTPALRQRAERIREGVRWVAVISSCVMVGVARVHLEAGPITAPAIQVLGGLAVLLATATAPHFAVESLAVLAVELAGLEESTHMPGFTNPSAFLGLFERPLLLASLVAGFPAFVGVWLVFKAASKWKGWDETDAGRRKFGVYSLNVAVSLTGVAVGWVMWRLLSLPVR